MTHIPRNNNIALSGLIHRSTIGLSLCAPRHTLIMALHIQTRIAELTAEAIEVCPARYVGSLVAEIDPNKLQFSLEVISSFAGVVPLSIIPWPTASISDILTILDAGAEKVFVNEAQHAELLAHDDVLATRLLLGDGSSIPLKMIHADEESRLAEALLHSATSDREDGLFPTVVTDESGIALGLVYSNKESVAESLKMGRGVYHSRKRGLWRKGESSGDVQILKRIELDCDSDCLRFIVRQMGHGFCHLETATCFGPYSGLAGLQETLLARKKDAPAGSYTKRLFEDPSLLKSKVMEEAEELCQAQTKADVAWEAADLIYFTMTKCVAAGVLLSDVEKNLALKHNKVKRRKGDAKPNGATAAVNGVTASSATVTPSSVGNQAGEQKATIGGEAGSIPPAINGHTSPSSSPPPIRMRSFDVSTTPPSVIEAALQRPSQRTTEAIMATVEPIIDAVRRWGDNAVLTYTHRFDKATSLQHNVLKAPFPPELMTLPQETIDAIDLAFANIHRFHAAQATPPLTIETMPGVTCSRTAHPIPRVGLYVPGGSAVLPSTAMMLGVPALVAGCGTIVLASPPRADGSLSPEIVYIAHRVGAACIVLAGGAQAVAAMAYGTETVPKVDKILGPGNQFVTAAKMIVSNDTTASVAIDMPAGPSEVLVIADATADPAFVASDLLSQAEHGPDSQVVLLAIALSDAELLALDVEIERQALALPRLAIVRAALAHSVTVRVPDLAAAMALSNAYAPEHLILHLDPSGPTLDGAMAQVQNAGSVFLGPWTPESVGDYAAGVNHSLPTYGYARQYSGVGLASFQKYISSSKCTKEGLRGLAGSVMRLAEVEGLEAHRRAVEIRLLEK